jgi:hypothetical protein
MTVLYPLQRSIPPRRRGAGWVGRPRIKLAEQLDKKLAEMGYECEIECGKIRPQQGAWRTDHRLDVMRLEGSIRVKIDGHWFNRMVEWAGGNHDRWTVRITDHGRECLRLGSHAPHGGGFVDSYGPRNDAELLDDGNAWYSAGQLEEMGQ